MLFSLLTPWVVALSLVALLVALSYEGLAKEIPDLYCAALEACAVFLLCMQANVIARQIVLLRLLSPGGACALTRPHRPSLSLCSRRVCFYSTRAETHTVQDIGLRMLLVLFPSTRPAYGLADQISQRWRTRHRGSHLHQGGLSFDNLGNESSPSPAAPPSIKRTMTRGGGALRDAITVDELPSLPKSASTIGEDDETPAFRSVIYVEATDAARVALPPVAASLLILSNNAFSSSSEST